MTNTGDPLQEVFESFDPKDYYLFDTTTANPTKQQQDPYSIHQQQQQVQQPPSVNTSGFDDTNPIINTNTPSSLQAGSVSPQPQPMDFLSPQDFRFAPFDDPQSFLNPYDTQTQPSAGDFLLPVSQPGHHRANSHSSDTSAAPSPQQFHSPYAASPVNPDDYAAEMAGLPELTFGLDLNSSQQQQQQQQQQQMNMAVSPMAMGMPDQMNHQMTSQVNQVNQMSQMNQMNQQHQQNLNPPIQMNHHSNNSHHSLSDLGDSNNLNNLQQSNNNQNNATNNNNNNNNTPGGVALSPSLLTPNMLSPNSSHQSYSSSPQTSQGSISSQSHQSIPMLNVEPPRDDTSRRRAHSDASHYSDRSSTPYEVPTLFPHATSSPSQVQDPADLLSPGDAASIQTRRSRSRSSSTSSDVRGARDQSHSPSRSPSQSGGNRSRSNSHSRDYILELAAPTSNNKRVQKHPSTFACHLCDKRFTRSYNLRSHLRTHTDERPFVCTVCGKAFARQHDRKRHEALHSGEKKYQCQGVLADGQTPWGCGRKFARADALGRHFKTEAGRECIRLLLEEEANEKQALSGQQVSYPGDGVPSLTFSPPAEPQNEPRPQQPVIFPAALLQKYPVLLNHLNED